MLWRTLFYLLFFISLAGSSVALASELPIYDQPNAASKVVGNVDLSAGVIPIYAPQNSDWMKVGDPRNGNVGWIKSSDLNAAGGVTFSQKIMNDGKGQHTYQTIQYGQPPQAVGLQPVKVNAQPDAQKQLQETIQNTVKRMNDLTQQLLNQMNANQQTTTTR